MTDKTPSKRSVAIAIMNANVGEPVPFVVAKIAEAIGVTEANAKSYYRYIAKNGLSEQKFVATPKAPKVPKVKAVVTKTENGRVRMARAPKATKPEFDVIDDRSFPEPDNLDRLALIRQTHKRMVADGRITTHGAKFNYDTREFEDSIPETNEVEDLCEMFSV